MVLEYNLIFDILVSVLTSPIKQFFLEIYSFYGSQLVENNSGSMTLMKKSSRNSFS